MKTETKILGIGMTQANVPKVMSGEKTQTRRIVNVGHKDLKFDAAIRLPDFNGKPCWELERHGALNAQVSAKHAVGDQLYVKEALKGSIDHDGTWARYKTDNLMVITRGGYRRWESDDGKPWKNKVIPARYMPRSAARTFIEITDVRCERIQEITESDAKAEGANRPYGRSPDAYDKYGTPEGIGFSYKLGFQKLWNDTNGKGAWDRNDWVFAYTFKLVEAPR